MRGALGMDGRRSIPRIADVLGQIDADVVCLQEAHRWVPWSWFVNQPCMLSRLLGMELAVTGCGVAVLTRLPVERRALAPLPNPRERRRRWMWFERRGYAEVAVRTPAGPLTVLATHWSLDATDRLDAARLMAERVNALATPAVLVGDLNARSEWPEMQGLLEATGLRDAGANAGPTYPADVPRVRIDYALMAPETGGISARVVDTQASDHRPLVVEW